MLLLVKGEEIEENFKDADSFNIVAIAFLLDRMCSCMRSSRSSAIFSKLKFKLWKKACSIQSYVMLLTLSVYRIESVLTYNGRLRRWVNCNWCFAIIIPIV